MKQKPKFMIMNQAVQTLPIHKHEISFQPFSGAFCCHLYNSSLFICCFFFCTVKIQIFTYVNYDYDYAFTFMSLLSDYIHVMLKSHLEPGALSSIQFLVLSNCDSLYLYQKLCPSLYLSDKLMISRIKQNQGYTMSHL